ncbi:hypothetical protein JCM10212_002527 [Sporobolomyces blumeae]
MDPVSAFRLTDLPHEVLLTIVKAVDEREPSPTFPRGPGDDLLNLSFTNRWFRSICRPLIWTSIRYKPTLPGPRPNGYREARSLRALNDLLDGPGESIKVQHLSVELSVDFLLALQDDDEPVDEPVELVRLVKRLANRGLQVLFLKDLEFVRQEAVDLLTTIATAPRLSALRFNQVEFQYLPKDFIGDLPRLDQVRTLQIMHGSAQLLNLVPKVPNLDSLLLWPSSRRLGVWSETIKSLLPRLRLLSMDSVRDPSTFRDLADEISRLAAQRFAEPLPLEELFLEGPLSASDRSVLVASLANLPSLRRLALYQAQNPTPTLLNEIYAARPDLDSLTIVAGNCDGSVHWPCPLDEYLPSLSQFRNLRFFASDRLPRPEEASAQLSVPLEDESTNPSQRRRERARARAELEFESFSKLVRACPSLQEAVAIDQDVSEGTSGYFASFQKEKGKTRIRQKMQTANDFLVSYERWVRVIED